MKILGLKSEVNYFNESYTIDSITRKSVTLKNGSTEIVLRTKEVIGELERGTLMIIKV